jgi:hypothetical protein
MIAPVIMAPSTLRIQLKGTVCFMIMVVILLDGAHLQTATAVRFRVPGSVDVNPSSTQLSDSEKAGEDDASVVVSTTVDTAVVEPADFIAMFTDSKQATEGPAGSYNHFNSWRLGDASPPPPASNVQIIRKINEPEESSPTVLHQQTFKFHAQRANKGSGAPSGPGGNPGGN